MTDNNDKSNEILYVLDRKITVKDPAFKSMEKLQASGNAEGLLSVARAEHLPDAPIDLQHVYEKAIGAYGESLLAKGSAGAVTYFSDDQDFSRAVYYLYRTMTKEDLGKYLEANGGEKAIKALPWVSGVVWSVARDTDTFEKNIAKALGDGFRWESREVMEVSYDGGKYRLGHVHVHDGTVFLDSSPSDLNEHGIRRPTAYLSNFNKEEQKEFLSGVIPKIKVMAMAESEGEMAGESPVSGESLKETEKEEDMSIKKEDSGRKYQYTAFHAIQPGSFPPEGLINAEEEKNYTPARGYGKLTYSRQLTDREVRDYELRPDTQLNGYIGRMFLNNADPDKADIAVTVNGYAGGSDERNPHAFLITVSSLDGDAEPQEEEAGWLSIITDINRKGYSLVPRDREEMLKAIIRQGAAAQAAGKSVKEGTEKEKDTDMNTEKDERKVQTEKEVHRGFDVYAILAREKAKALVASFPTEDEAEEYIFTHSKEYIDKGEVLYIKPSAKAEEEKAASRQTLHEDDDADTDVVALSKKYVASGMSPEAAEKKAKEDLRDRQENIRKEEESRRTAQAAKEKAREESRQKEEEDRKRTEEARRARQTFRGALVGLIAAGHLKDRWGNATVMFRNGDEAVAYGGDARTIAGLDKSLELKSLYPDEAHPEESSKIEMVSFPIDKTDSYSLSLTQQGGNVLVADADDDNSITVHTPSGLDRKPQETKPLEGAEKYETMQRNLLSDALASSLADKGIWINKDLKGAPVLLNDMKHVAPFNSILITLDSDRYGYRIPAYIDYRTSRAKQMAVHGRKKGEAPIHYLPLSWTQWAEVYKNRHDASFITANDFQSLSPARKKDYFRVQQEKYFSVFNVDETILAYRERRKPDDKNEYKKLLREHGASPKPLESTLISRIEDMEKKDPGYLHIAEMDNVYKAYGRDAEEISKVLEVEPWKVEGPRGDSVSAVAFAKKDMNIVVSLLTKADRNVTIIDNAERSLSERMKAGTNENIAYDRIVEAAKAAGKTAGFKVRQDVTTDRTVYDPAKDAVVIGRQGADEPSVDVRAAKVHDVIMAVSKAMGAHNRLDRAKNLSIIPSDAARLDLLVDEIAAGYYLSRNGLSSSLSETSRAQVPFWQQELAGDKDLFSNLKRATNNTVEVIDKAVRGEKIDFSRIRGAYPDMAVNRLKKENLTIVRGIGSETVNNGNDKRFGIIRDRNERKAYVIMPEGASMDWRKPTKGLSLHRINDALLEEGFEKVSFHTVRGTHSLPMVNDSFAEGVTASTAALKDEKIADEKPVDIEALREKSRLTKISMTKMFPDNDKKWHMLVVPTDGKYIIVTPTKDERDRIFTNRNERNHQDVVSAIGRKYYDKAQKNPSVNQDFLTPRPKEEALKALDELGGKDGVKIVTGKVKNHTGIFMNVFAKSDRNNTKPLLQTRQITSQQNSNQYIFPDKEFGDGVNLRENYRRLLAGTVWEDVLSKRVSERQSQPESQSQSAARQYHQEEPSVRESQSLKTYHI